MTTTHDSSAKERARRTRMWFLIGGLAFSAVALVITALKDRPVRGSSGFRFDPVLHIPLPPLDAPYHETRDLIVIAIFGTMGIAGVIWAARTSVKERSWLPVMVGLSALMVVIPEVLVDVVGLVWYPHSTHPLYTIFGREMGWFIVAGWLGYAVLAFVEFQLLKSQPKTKSLWILLGGAVVLDVVNEEFILNFSKSYVYYGNQPLILISKLPWWWIPCNSIGVFLAAALVYRLRDQLQGWRSLAAFFITPLSVAAAYGAIALPSFIVTNGDYPWLPTQLCGLLTLALGGMLYVGILKVILGREPFDMQSKSIFDSPTVAGAPSTTASRDTEEVRA
jgi:hypothetical protein